MTASGWENGVARKRVASPIVDRHGCHHRCFGRGVSPLALFDGSACLVERRLRIVHAMVGAARTTNRTTIPMLTVRCCHSW